MPVNSEEVGALSPTWCTHMASLDTCLHHIKFNLSEY